MRRRAQSFVTDDLSWMEQGSQITILGYRLNRSVRIENSLATYPPCLKEMGQEPQGPRQAHAARTRKRGSMNLCKLYEQVQQIPSIRYLSEETRRIWSVRIFDNLIDFLRTPQTFPNHEINALVTHAWELIGWKTIPLIEDQWELPLPALSRPGSSPKRVPFFIMPLTFLDLVRKDTPMQLGAVICMASQGQDFEWQQLDLLPMKPRRLSPCRLCTRRKGSSGSQTPISRRSSVAIPWV